MTSCNGRTIASPEHPNVAFPVTLTAKDAHGYTVTAFNGQTAISGLVGSRDDGDDLR